MFCTDSISIDSGLGCVGTHQLQQQFQGVTFSFGIRDRGAHFPFNVPTAPCGTNNAPRGLNDLNAFSSPSGLFPDYHSL